MPKFSAYLRGEGTIGPTGPQGESGPVGPSQHVLFDVDVSTGYLLMYTDYDVLESQVKANFKLDDTGHLVVVI